MHMSIKQRIDLAVIMLPHAQEEARVRQAATLIQNAGPLASVEADGKRTDKMDAPRGKEKGKAAAIVAEALNLSRAQVERAAQLKKADPEAYEKLPENAAGLTTAVKKLKNVDTPEPKPSKESERKIKDTQLAAALFAWFFQKHHVDQAANAQDWRRVRRLVNGALNGFDVFAEYVRILISALNKRID